MDVTSSKISDFPVIAITDSKKSLLGIGQLEEEEEALYYFSPGESWMVPHGRERGDKTKICESMVCVVILPLLLQIVEGFELCRQISFQFLKKKIMGSQVLLRERGRCEKKEEEEGIQKNPG